MDVVGEHILTVDECRRALFKSLEGQTISGINARRTQDTDAYARACAPIAQHLLGIDPTGSTAALRIQRPGLIDPGTGAIAVNPCRAYVNQAAW